MDKQTLKSHRRKLLQIFSATLSRLHGGYCVSNYLQSHPLPDQLVRVVAVGKAAGAMMEGALQQLGTRLESGLVITRYGYGQQLNEHIQVIEASHPIPDANSLTAGQALVEFVSDCDPSRSLLVLMSGGASALVDVLEDDVTIESLARINQWLLSAPLTIQQINAVRAGLSRIKSGKLLNYLNTPHCWQLTLSDVMGNDLSVVGSGLLVRPASIVNVPVGLPDWIQSVTDRSATALPLEKNQNPNVQHVVLADNHLACEQVQQLAEEQGLSVVENSTVEGEAEVAGRRCARAIIDGSPGLYVWGGETVVALPDEPGMGGRCQQLALAAAIELAGRDDVLLLAAGTDGADGPQTEFGDVAGAIVDGQTVERARAEGYDPANCLKRADAGRCLIASGDLLDTGPTGTNVNDLVLGLKIAK